MNGIYAIKPAFQRALKPLEKQLLDSKVHPDLITGSALLISLAGAGALALAGQPGMLFLLCTTPITAFVRTVLNALDGMVANRSGMARPWGEVLNEFSDRLSDTAIFLGLAFSRLGNPQLIMVTLISVLLSSYLGLLSKAAGGPRQYGGLLGKADRMVLLGLCGPLAFFLDRYGICSAAQIIDVFALLVLGGSLITVFQRARKTYVDLQSAHK